MHKISGALLAVFSFLSQPAEALTHPLRNARNLPGGRTGATIASHLKDARVVIADHALLKRDFQYLEELTPPEIDDWLLANAAIMAVSQLEQGPTRLIHAPPSVDETLPKLVAYRPPFYGRALVTWVEGGLLEVKGAGARTPLPHLEENGVLTLYDALRDFRIEKLIHAMGENEAHLAGRPVLETVENYAVIDLGTPTIFADPITDIIQATGPEHRMALLVRQAHRRHDENWVCFSDNESLPVEVRLRKYGVT